MKLSVNLFLLSLAYPNNWVGSAFTNNNARTCDSALFSTPPFPTARPASPFGAPAAPGRQASPFGAAPGASGGAPASPFGAAPASPFGAPAAPGRQASPFGAAPGASGGAAPGGASPFGAAAAPAAASPFGAAPASPFGAAPAAASPFGAPAAPGAASPFGTSPAPAAASPFGAPAGPAAASPFGAPAAPGGASPFGAAAAPAAASPFGAPAAPAAASPFGAPQIAPPGAGLQRQMTSPTGQNTANTGAQPGLQRNLDRQVGSDPSPNLPKSRSRRRKVPLSDVSPSWLTTAVPQLNEMSLTPATDVWEYSSPVVVQGQSLRTCSFDKNVERMEVILKSEGRPLNANVELWQGPDNTPQRIKVYLEDGHESPFRAIFETPGGSNSIAVLNTGNLEFPMAACIAPHVDRDPNNPEGPADNLASVAYPKTVQGGAISTTPLGPEVMSVQILLETDGRPMNAKIEILQGPNNMKQIMEVYCEDGMTRPFFVVVETPEAGNVVRIVNTSTMEYPIKATVEPYLIDQGGYIPSPDDLVWSD